MLATSGRPTPQGVDPEEAEQDLALIITDERGLVAGFSPNLKELGLEATPDRVGRHWTELFPSYRRVPTRFGGEDDFIVMLETSRKAFRVERRLLVGNGDCRRSACLLLRPFERTEPLGGELSYWAVLNNLAASVAHEINNPLTIISGWIQMMLADARQDDPAREQIESVQEELDRIARIVDKLMVFAQKPRAEIGPLDVNELVRNTIAFTEFEMRNANVTVEMRLSPDVAAVEGNAGELKQVFLNLAVNARQAMPDGGVLRVTTDVSQDGALVETRFADTGHGVAPEICDRLFQPNVTTRAAQGGCGLGLSVSRDIMQRMGGNIQLESTSPSGSVFLLALPVAKRA